MKTILELIHLSADYLKNKGIEQPKKSAEELIADALNLKKIDLYLFFDRPVDEEELAKVRALLLRRGQGEPWQYIKGEVEFYGCQLKVGPSVLIPRQETEILVDNIVKELKRSDLQGKMFCDLCSGSGCIGLAIKKSCPELNVTLVDISHEALILAKENAEANQLSVNLVQSDFFSDLKGAAFHFIASNPPYISRKDYERLGKEVKDFEPKLALIGGENGLVFYERFAREGAGFLKSGGSVWFEIGYDQAASVYRLFNQSPWRNLKVNKDWSGQDRFFSLEIE